MAIALLVLLIAMAILGPLYGYDSRDGMDRRGYDEALRYRAGVDHSSRV
jgi:hypothetical protein